ncbi:hypothetical protein [Desertivibrio insolitus]|uniref:hypothetical protein n=1 Tax=Herbiconiux sp. SYSU D00978 TaxID=2812562 RepID=UPI001A95D83C|nr:hypothetical protein [Herbiconiux sp. SYSU D00978]
MITSPAGVPRDLLLPAERQETTYRSGPWSLTVRRGELDDIVFDGAVGLRSIRFVVRDRDWGTVPSGLRSLEVTEDGLMVKGEAARSDVVVPWELRVRADEERLTVDLAATSTTAFLRNRIGLIVLHPADLAGRELVVGHSDGSTETTQFPTTVAPHQPARDIASLGWQRDGVDFRVQFGGDVFEMEDQRNWTDASFKTYSTPLSLPFPVELQSGESVQQSIAVQASRVAPRAAAGADDPRVLRVSGVTPGRMPEIARSATSAPDTSALSTEFRGTVLVELDLRLPGWRAMLERACGTGATAIDLRLVADDVAGLRTVLDALPAEESLPLARVAVFDSRTHATDAALLPLISEELRNRGRRAEVVAGTRAHFTELNRHHGKLSDWPGALTFSITPFMHDISGHQLIESLPVQRVVVESAGVIADGRRMHIGPITLGARFNAVATSAFEATGDETMRHGYGPEFVAGATDPRQHAPSFGAWVVGSLAALAAGDVASLTYFETSGPRGTVTEGGGRTPADLILQWAAELSGAPLLEVSAPGLHAVGVRQNAEDVILLGNLAAEPVSVDLQGHAEVVFADGADASAGRRIELAPGAAARVSLPHA